MMKCLITAASEPLAEGVRTAGDSYVTGGSVNIRFIFIKGSRGGVTRWGLLAGGYQLRFSSLGASRWGLLAGGLPAGGYLPGGLGATRWGGYLLGAGGYLLGAGGYLLGAGGYPLGAGGYSLGGYLLGATCRGLGATCWGATGWGATCWGLGANHWGATRWGLGLLAAPQYYLRVSSYSLLPSIT